MPDAPTWLVPEPYTDIDLGPLRSGKEAQISVIERSNNGRSCLLARKHYLPREVKEKGTLESLGVQRASQFRHDVAYREGRQFRRSRDRRAVAQMSGRGKRLLQDRWVSHEHDVVAALWRAGVSVPYPVGFSDERFDMQYLGDRDGAASTLARLRPRGPLLCEMWEQLVENLRLIVSAGYAHGDLSAYNLLWWRGQVWVIDPPQAVDLAANPRGIDFLHRDVVNVSTWFARQGLDRDAEATFADLLGAMRW